MGLEKRQHDTVGHTVTTSPDDFTTTIITTLVRLTRPSHPIRAFFGDPNLHYITA